jgi:hypothetical protein
MPYIGNPIYQSAFVTDQFTGNGSTTAFTMSVAPAGVSNVLVAVSGVLQDPSTYSVVGNTLTFTAAPPSGTGNISCRYLGVPASGVTTTAYRTVTEFTATASQTTFTPPSYTVGFINVYLNGVLLGSADYTASNGTTVVLATGASAGNLLTVESFLVSSVLNAIPNTAGSVSSSNIQTSVALTTPTMTSPTISSGALTIGTTSLGAGNASSFKNRIINGAMTFDQRNAGASVTPASNPTYTLDRWVYTYSQNSKFSVQQNAGSVTPPAGFTNYIGFTSLAATSLGSTDYFILRQMVEGFNTADLAFGTASAKTITLSFWVRSSLTGTFGGAISNSGESRNYPFTYTISSANTWEQKSVTIAGDTSGTWLTTNGIGIELSIGLGVGSTYSGTAGAWTSSLFVGATGATNVAGTNGATFYLTGVQLEVGSTATSFDYRPYTTELQLCQRYLPAFRATASTYDYLAPVFSAGGTGLWVTFQFLVTARVPPTGITSSAMSTFLAVVAGTGYAPTAATLTSAVSRTGAVVEFTNGSPPSAGLGGFFRFDNSGNGYIYFTGCEL